MSQPSAEVVGGEQFRTVAAPATAVAAPAPAAAVVADPYQTDPSLLAQLRSPDARPREVGWREFYHRYVPIIRGFARSLGVQGADVEDVVQEVLIGFFGAGSRGASFTYDPAKGRFRGYLKRATVNALAARHRRRGAAAGTTTVSLDALTAGGGGGAGGGDVAATASAAAQQIEDAWTAEWERQRMEQAMDEVRRGYKDNKTFRAFEMYAILGTPAEDVARETGLSVDGVYQAKRRVTEALRKKVAELEAREP